MGGKIIQLGIAGMVIAGFVVLTLRGADTNGFVALVAPILGAVFVINHLDQRSDKQDQKLKEQGKVLEQQDQVLSEIHENTNGVLAKKIRDAVGAVLDERGL